MTIFKNVVVQEFVITFFFSFSYFIFVWPTLPFTLFLTIQQGGVDERGRTFLELIIFVKKVDAPWKNELKKVVFFGFSWKFQLHSCRDPGKYKTGISLYGKK